ncbi:polysaccharide lyase family 4 protein [Xylariales sp. PMI_506]|nr:polysaccharide lyase family 4 protein [Xylariales sp. PMI_506]
MKVSFSALASLLALAAPATPTPLERASGPFLTEVDNSTWIFGNELWNVTQGVKYAKQLYYKDQDCVGAAVGHYVSYTPVATETDLSWTSASIAKEGTYQGSKYIDIKFTAAEGDFHWVVFSGLAGAYQYFVNHNLPVCGEFRTLWRLNNQTFLNGSTDIKDEALPLLSEYLPQNKVQDETWLNPDGVGYITKYDWQSFVRTQTAYGVYGEGFGSWFINPGKDYYNGDHLKQELMVHRESSTGDVVQLNMIHGTHFMVSASDFFPDNKTWGPWLWYLNDGQREDAELRAKKEFESWPYSWLNDQAYQSRGSVSGKLVLSDGRPATNAAVFLGDNNPNETALDMGSKYYYTTYADAKGNFEFTDVRTAVYGLQAWSNGSKIADVTTSVLQNGVVVEKGKNTDLKTITWAVSNKTKLFQVGDFDRTSYGFQLGGAPHANGLVANCPANLTFTVGTSSTEDWCFGQSKIGNWSIVFNVDDEQAAPPAGENATLIISLASFSIGVSSNVYANDVLIGNLTTGTPKLLNDPSLYRSGTTAGEWRYIEFPFAASALTAGSNEIVFEVIQNTTWHGFMWDSIVLEW